MHTFHNVCLYRGMADMYARSENNVLHPMLHPGHDAILVPNVFLL